MIKRIYIGLAALLMTLGLSAQNMTSSPYSRYAYGDLNENVPTAYRAMGGVSFGLRNNRAINPAQPASYTACDTLTFMFDIAASAGWSKYQDASGHRNKPNGNLEYVTMQFPLYKRWIAMSLGLLPYSSVGYNISLNNSTAGDAYHYTTDYYGRGNISQVYSGLSFNILNWLAVGANIYYMWGDLNHMRSLTFAETGFNPTLQYEVLRVSNLRARLGAQFFHTWGDHTVNVGAIFESRMTLHSQMLILETQTADSIPIIEGAWQLPFVYGAGVSYNWQNRITVALDFERQLMGDARYNGMPGRASGLRNKNRLALGFEYRHNPLSRKYGERMLFRVGAAMQDEYLLAIKAKHYTATAGIGFPIPMLGTVLNTTFEYHHRGQKSTLEEHSFRFILGLSIGENWFFKRKL